MAKEKIEHPVSFNDNYTEQDKADTKRVIDWLNEDKIRSQAFLARAVGLSQAAISNTIKGTYPGATGEVLRQLIAVVDDKHVAVKAGQVVHTSVYQLVKASCDNAKETGRFSVITGSPGVGKTTAAEDYARINPSTIYIRGSEFTTATVILDDLITALKLKNRTGHTKAAKAKKIIEALKGSNRLIILDEADKCTKDSPDPLRTISDETGCGVVLAGNVPLRDAIKAGDHHYDLIADRVTFWPNAIFNISLKDASDLLRPHLTDSQLGEDFNVLVKYAHELTEGSARKLIDAMLAHLKRVLRTYPDKLVTCEMLQAIGKNWMGLHNPPAIPQKNQPVVIPN
jgi:DNA transposition AAA+ family ATPase